MSYLFESERLGFRPWISSDFDFIHKLNADKDVMKYFLRTLDEDENRGFLDELIKRYDRDGFTFFCAEIKESKEIIGLIGITYFEFDFLSGIEIGWRLYKDYWHMGYATEGANRNLEYAKSLGLNKIYSFTAEINMPSRKVMERIGMNKLSEFNHPRIEEGNKLRKHVLYEINL